MANISASVWIAPILVTCFVTQAALGADTEPDKAKIEQLTGLKATVVPQENVVKVSLPRTDIKPTITGVKVNPEMGLTVHQGRSANDGDGRYRAVRIGSQSGHDRRVEQRPRSDRSA